MAGRLTPSHVVELHLKNTTPETFLVIAIEAAKAKNWNIGYASEAGFTAYTNKTFRSHGEEVKVVVDGDMAIIRSICTGNQVVDWGKNKENVEGFLETYQELAGTLTSEEVQQKYEELRPALVSKEDERLSKPTGTTKENLESFKVVFTPIKGYYITPLIVDANIIIYLLMILSGVNFFLPDSESIVRWGGNFAPYTLHGQVWRLITSCFIHIGIMHLLVNMYVLVFIGLQLEPFLGKIRFLAAYLFAGIAGSLTSLYWHHYNVSAGASGAIFGLFGVFLAMLTTNMIEKAARKPLLTSVSIFIVYSLINGMKGATDNAAHVGGLLSGLVVGHCYYPGLQKPHDSRLKYLVVGILAALVLIAIFIFS